MENRVSSLRTQIFGLLREGTTSAAEDLEALSQCVAHIQDRMLVEGIARECGVTLTRFLTNDTLDLYYDIKRGRHDLGYISKGWEDPGFRIGDTVEIDPWEADAFKAHAAELARFSATRGMAMTLVTRAPMSTEIQMDGVIYSEGFNRDTFEKTLESINACVEEIHRRIPDGRRGRDPRARYFCGNAPSALARVH
jgi:hypothetical protein